MKSSKTLLPIKQKDLIEVIRFLTASSFSDCQWIDAKVQFYVLGSLEKHNYESIDIKTAKNLVKDHFPDYKSYEVEEQDALLYFLTIHIYTLMIRKEFKSSIHDTQLHFLAAYPEYINEDNAEKECLRIFCNGIKIGLEIFNKDFSQELLMSVGIRLEGNKSTEKINGQITTAEMKRRQNIYNKEFKLLSTKTADATSGYADVSETIRSISSVNDLSNDEIHSLVERNRQSSLYGNEAKKGLQNSVLSSMDYSRLSAGLCGDSSIYPFTAYSSKKARNVLNHSASAIVPSKPMGAESMMPGLFQPKDSSSISSFTSLLAPARPVMAAKKSEMQKLYCISSDKRARPMNATEALNSTTVPNEPFKEYEIVLNSDQSKAGSSVNTRDDAFKQFINFLEENDAGSLNYREISEKLDRFVDTHNTNQSDTPMNVPAQALMLLAGNSADDRISSKSVSKRSKTNGAFQVLERISSDAALQDFPTKKPAPAIANIDDSNFLSGSVFLPSRK